MDNLAVSVEEMRAYLLIDHNLHDDEIQSSILASQEELEYSGIPFPKTKSELYNLAIKMMVAKTFEDKTDESKGGIRLDTILAKLAISRGVSK